MTGFLLPFVILWKGHINLRTVYNSQMLDFIVCINGLYLLIYFCLPYITSNEELNWVNKTVLTQASVSARGYSSCGWKMPCIVDMVWRTQCHGLSVGWCLVADSGTEDGWGCIYIASLELYSVPWCPFVRRESSTVSKIDCTALVLALISDHAFHIDCFCAVWPVGKLLKNFSRLYNFITKG